MKSSVSTLSEKIAGETIAKCSYSNQEMDAEILAEGKEQFGNLLLEKIEEDGYDITELKDIGKKDPKKIITILAEVISKNVEYDYEKYKLVQEKRYDEIKQQNYYLTLRDGKGVCEDYSELFAVAKLELEKQGVPNLDKFVVLETTPHQDTQNHTWNNIITINKDGNIVMTAIDITWADHKNPLSISGKLNAVDESHYYKNIKEKTNDVNTAHQKALEKIKDYNIFAFQKKLKKVLTEYDSRQYTRDHRHEGNKELRKTNKDIELTREEKTGNVKKGLEVMRNKFKKAHAKKDSENE